MASSYKIGCRGDPCGRPGTMARHSPLAESTDGQPQGPHPHVHILSCPYYTRAVRADSPYSRGEWGEDAGGGPLWSPVRYLLSCTCLLLLLALFLAACGGTNSLPT